MVTSPEMESHVSPPAARRWKRAGTVALGLTAVVLALLFQAEQTPELLARSKRLGPARPWPKDLYYHCYLSQHEYLASRRVSGKRTFCKLDLSSGVESSLPGITSRFGGTGSPVRFVRFQRERQWLLMDSRSGDFCGVTLDGKLVFSRKFGSADVLDAMTSADGEVLMAAREGSYYARTVDIRSLRIAGNSAPARKWRIRLPDGENVISLSFSPGRDRIAWLLESWRSTTWSRLYSSMVRPRGGGPPATLSVWVSDARGANMRKLGEMERHSMNGELDPSVFQWTPDGRQIGFVCRNSFWRTPAD
jgi:hypothetical protein